MIAFLKKILPARSGSKKAGEARFAPLRFFNTMSGAVEVFEPRKPPRVLM